MKLNRVPFKWLPAVVALLAAGAAVAADSNNGTAFGAKQQVKTTTWTVANSLATNVATLNQFSGLAVDRGGAVAVVLSAEATRTISGGALRCYVWMPVYEPNQDGGVGVTFRWMPYASLDFTPATGGRDSPSGDKQAFTGIGRIVWVPDAVTVSGGTTVVTTISTRAGMP